MKCPRSISLSVVSVLAGAVTGCGPTHPYGVDPCLPATYNQPACEYATAHQGYYYNGLWYPHIYSHPYLWYNQGYDAFVLRGGRVQSIAPDAYVQRVGGAVDARTGVVRGGFGAAGEAHAAASAGE